MNKLNTLVAIVALFISFSAGAQVKFKLTYDNTTERYTVSLVPMATYQHPQNITGTGQVTIKVASNQFDPVDLLSNLEGMNWEANSRNDGPDEDPDHDYISFGLNIQGIAYPDYKEGVELPLFSFQNAFGCNGMVALVDNATDAFMPPNSENSNIGNTLTILGAGGDAYAGLIGNAEVDCATATTDANEVVAVTDFKIFPNPAIDFANVEVNWEGDAADAHLQVVDAAGKIVINEEMPLTNGKNKKRLMVSNLPSGNYMVYLQGDDWKLSLNNLVKQQ